jgi:Flp pilus assembly protein TadG
MKIIKCKKGAAAVEFAIIAPLLFTILFGIIECGLLFFDKAIITNASREGARYGILFNPTRPNLDEIRARVLAYTSTHLVTFGGSTSPVVAVNWENGTPEDSSSGDALTVEVSYNYDFLLLPNFVTSLSNVSQIKAVTVMRME